MTLFRDDEADPARSEPGQDYRCHRFRIGSEHVCGSKGRAGEECRDPEACQRQWEKDRHAAMGAVYRLRYGGKRKESRFRQFLRRLSRYPRLISYHRWTQLVKQLPNEQRKRSQQSIQKTRLLKAHTLERQLHRIVLREKEELKAILRNHAPDVLHSWVELKKAEQKAKEGKS